MNTSKELGKAEYQPMDMPKQVSAITCEELMYLAAGRYGRKQAREVELRANTKRMNVKIREDENQLDRRYAELRTKIVELKKAKNIMKSLVKVSQAAQTEKIVGDESLNELIDINTQRTLHKISDLLKVKTQVNNNPQDYPSELKISMFDDIHSELKEQLFYLLMAVVKDETFINYSEYFKGLSREQI
jgi:hypothetical protein